MIARSDQGFGWYALFRVKGLGSKRLHLVHETMRNAGLDIDELFGMDWERFHELLPGLSRSIFDATQALDLEQTELEYNQLSEQGVRIIHLGDQGYPAIVSQRMGDNAPAVLFCLGNVRLLQSESVAIVGSRDASAQGLRLAGELAKSLAVQGKNVISGYARGVDTEAHQGALKGEGTTTIVLSTGILDFSPKKAFEDVHWERDVLVLSQFHPADKWRAANAMIRNSLVCALSSAVIVIEAGEERDAGGKMSGTFAAGRTALEMGVRLLVLDPDVFEQSPKGNAQLIALGGLPLRPEVGIASMLEGMSPTAPAPAPAAATEPSLFD